MSVCVEQEGAVFVVTLERPERRNAIDAQTALALADAFRSFESNDQARVAVLWGKGGNFCAGADLKAIAEGHPNRLEPDGDAPLGPTRMLLSKPVIAAVAGYAVAGGMELALWCDLRVVEEDTTFGFFERRWGVPLIDGGTIRLPRLIGLSRALDLILTGRAVSAQEALQIGLAHRVVPTGTSRDAAISLAHDIAAFPQQCLRNDRRSAYLQHDLSLEEALQQEFSLGQEAIFHETQAGAIQFAQGRGRHGQF